VIKFDASIIFKSLSQFMDCQIHIIGKAIRPLFVDLVTNVFCNAYSIRKFFGNCDFTN